MSRIGPHGLKPAFKEQVFVVPDCDRRGEGEMHRIRVTKKGRIQLLDHPNLKADTVMHRLGSRKRCLELLEGMRAPLVFPGRDDEHLHHLDHFQRVSGRRNRPREMLGARAPLTPADMDYELHNYVQRAIRASHDLFRMELNKCLYPKFSAEVDGPRRLLEIVGVAIAIPQHEVPRLVFRTLEISIHWWHRVWRKGYTRMGGRVVLDIKDGLVFVLDMEADRFVIRKYPWEPRKEAK